MNANNVSVEKNIVTLFFFLTHILSQISILHDIIPTLRTISGESKIENNFY